MLTRIKTEQIAMVETFLARKGSGSDITTLVIDLLRWDLSLASTLASAVATLESRVRALEDQLHVAEVVHDTIHIEIPMGRDAS
jgi:hypothetical protein